MNVNCHDLIASWISYGIDVPGGVTAYPAADKLGLIGPVTCFETGRDEVDACYVGETATEIVLSFRGTALPIDGFDTQVADWINNFEAKPIYVRGFPGRVHEGFYRSIANLAALEGNNFISEIRRRQAASPNKSLLVTGYSKGAALAPLAAVLLRNADIPIGRIVIFEPPRCGDADFARQFNAWFPNATRYEYQDDLVPHVPPRQIFMNAIAHIPRIGPRLEKDYDIDDWNYCPVGKLYFINWDREVVAVDELPYWQALSLEAYRLFHLVAVLVARPSEAILDHLPCTGLWDMACASPCPWTVKFLLRAHPKAAALRPQSRNLLDARKAEFE